VDTGSREENAIKQRGRSSARKVGTGFRDKPMHNQILQHPTEYDIRSDAVKGRNDVLLMPCSAGVAMIGDKTCRMMIGRNAA
jgi:hypothetical protein